MAQTIEQLEVRKKILKGRNSNTVDNSKIIAKINRKIRKLKAAV